MLFYVFFCVVVCILCCSMYFLCCMYFCVVLCIVCFVSFSVLFVCICVLYYCHRVATQLQLNISYHSPSMCFVRMKCKTDTGTSTGLQSLPITRLLAIVVGTLRSKICETLILYPFCSSFIVVITQIDLTFGTCIHKVKRT